MNIISGIALVLLSMVGYSMGAMIAGGKKKINPSLLDIVTLVIIWVIALLTRVWLGNKWLAIGVWILIGLLLGGGMVFFQGGSYPKERKYDKDPIQFHGIKRIWEGWKAFTRRIGNYQSRLLLALFYIPVVIPFGIIVRSFQDPLQMKNNMVKSRWVPRSKTDHGLESIQKQF
jgi:hypothetical protein